MINTSNAWPNYYAGVLWLVVFIGFVVARYPHHHKGGKQ